jgi:hypothetical protein
MLRLKNAKVLCLLPSQNDETYKTSIELPRLLYALYKVWQDDKELQPHYRTSV